MKVEFLHLALFFKIVLKEPSIFPGGRLFSFPDARSTIFSVHSTSSAVSPNSLSSLKEFVMMGSVPSFSGWVPSVYVFNFNSFPPAPSLLIWATKGRLKVLLKSPPIHLTNCSGFWIKTGKYWKMDHLLDFATVWSIITLRLRKVKCIRHFRKYQFCQLKCDPNSIFCRTNDKTYLKMTHLLTDLGQQCIQSFHWMVK